MNRRKRTLKGVRFSTRGSSTSSNTLRSAATDSQSTGDGTPTQSAEEVLATPAETTKGTKRKCKPIWQPIGMEASKLAKFLGTIARTGSICPLNTKHWKHLSKYVLENILRIVHEKFDLQGKVKDFDILSHVGKLRKEFKSTLKSRYYKEMAQSERAKESRTNVRYAHIAGRTGYATLNAQFAEKEGREPSHLEQFRFQHLRKDGSDNFSSDAAEQVYVYTQVSDPDKNGKMLGYGRGMTKSRLFGYGSVTRGSQSASAINTLIEEMNAKHVEQIQTIQAEQAVREKTLLEEA
ncbi:hypothetical protein GOBAR_AA35360 [Gossypium barbadense]|uniref:Uncharacterized protein n=1 Tax=Gossypium barbadense TaxID=3634 RepID=A0A2P5W2K7_GOSBA|nr:hypothetical protein GOBAR_AA35360 [Gossypium barbadense]